MKRLLLTLALGCSLAACAGDDSSNPSTTTTAAGSESTDQRVADEAVLVLSDVPSGWGEVDGTDDDDEPAPADQAAFADCLGVDVSVVEDSDEPTTRTEFETESADVEVSSRVTVSATAADGEAEMAALKAPGAADCVRGSFEAQLAANGAPGTGDVSVAELPFEQVGDESVAFLITVPIDAPEGTIEVNLVSVTAIKGRATTEMEFVTVSRPFDADEALRLTELVVDRIPDDL